MVRRRVVKVPVRSIEREAKEDTRDSAGIELVRAGGTDMSKAAPDVERKRVTRGPGPEEGRRNLWPLGVCPADQRRTHRHGRSGDTAQGDRGGGAQRRATG
ncbi:hypothetical protein CLOM_g11155 [Closterium sp. NIES-68]|nr:hypothetical protein CLOM_g11155 [Closterium sp. NIES-68]